MVINVKNNKWIFLYKTNLFKLFIYKTNNIDMQNIVNALNIKSRRKRITYVYEEAIKVINNYYSDDLCQFKDNQCIAQRKNNSKTTNGCCRTCPLLTNNGCSSVNITCKLLYCKTALNNMKSLKLSDINILKCLSVGQRLILKTDYYSTKKQVINDLYYGIVIYFIRSFFRDVKRDFKNIFIRKINML